MLPLIKLIRVIFAMLSQRTYEAFDPQAAPDPPPCVDECTPDAEEGNLRHEKR